MPCKTDFLKLISRVQINSSGFTECTPLHLGVRTTYIYGVVNDPIRTQRVKKESLFNHFLSQKLQKE